MKDNRRNFIKSTSLLGAIALFNSPIKSFGIIHKKMNEEQLIGHGDFRYKVNKNWAQIGMGYYPLINCHEMVQDQSGKLYMIGDHLANNILVFDESGKLLDSWSHAFRGGHGLSIGGEGKDQFLMLTDCGWFQNREGKGGGQSGQVIKTDLQGRLIFAIGHPRTIGIYDEKMPFKPTETAIAPNGDIYVADGYGSDYIIQYNSDGQYIRHFGGHGNANPDHNLQNAHGVAVDIRDPEKPKLICTSRNETCFKVFTLEGQFIERIDLPGMHVCRAVLHGKNMYAGVCWSDNEKGETNWGDSGFVTILDRQNKVVSNPGGTAPRYENGKLKPSVNLESPVFQHGHDVCVDKDENLYVCQWNANHTAPVKLTRV